MRSLLELPYEPDKIIAIGDVHGCRAELDVLLEELERAGDLAGAFVVFLGDIIDRGPDSKGCIESIVQLAASHRTTAGVRGNHEEVLLRFMDGVSLDYVEFLQRETATTFRSYGFDDVPSRGEFLEALPPKHLEYLLSLQRGILTPSFAFVHAGFRPGVRLHEQRDRDLYWIRDEFIESRCDFRKLVVFGHTPYEDVLVDTPYKIGIDTGLVFGNFLTALIIPAGEVVQVKLGERTCGRRSIL